MVVVVGERTTSVLPSQENRPTVLELTDFDLRVGV